MKKGKIHPISLLFSAVVSAALFYVIARKGFLFFWNFDLVSARHWNHIIERWQDGWVIHKPKEVMFFLGLLALLPSYFGMWFLVYIFPLKRVLLSPKTFLENRKKAKLEAQSLAAALGPENKQELLKNKKDSEKVIKISSQKLHQIDHLRGKGTAGTATAGTSGHGAPTGGEENVRHPEQEKTDDALSRFNLWENLANGLEAKKIFILRKMKIQSFPVNIFAITQEGLFLLCEGPEENESWEVCEGNDPPVWKFKNGEIPSPLRPMVTARSVLQKYFEKEMLQYAALSVNCCMILDHGDIVNTDEMLKYLEEWDISVLRMGTCKTSALPDTNALIEYIKSQPASSQALNDSVAVAILDLMETENGE